MSGDMKSVIVPKSDQLNADDLISGPITIKVTGVAIRQGGEQPISISYEGDGGKPYKACKSMCRVMVAAWGADSKQYAGRSMTLYRDPSVKWAGLEVGGIRISHMSDIDAQMTMALTMTKQSRKPFTVKPLASGKPTESAGTRAGAPTQVATTERTGADSPSSPADPYLTPDQQLEISDECRKLGNCLPLLLKAASKAVGSEITSIQTMPAASLEDCRAWLADRAERLSKRPKDALAQ